jgi:4-hydroxythreonine-4-phosphate dehydrogenase
VKRVPLLGVTAGDPAGIGPEVLAKALAQLDPGEAEIRFFGPEAARQPGQPTPEGAKQAWEALEAAATAAQNGEVDAVVTGPVSKKELQAIGFPYPGQTEFFAARAGVEDFCMILTGGKITVALVTVHVPLADVSSLLTIDGVVSTARHLLNFTRARGIAHPRLALAGVNPHAGEGGTIGREEMEILQPAWQRLEEETPGVFSPPVSPDTVFHECLLGRFDGVVCPYHDQGLIPLKLHAFDEGVNVTWGLPFLRTSPDHGTAFSLAGRNEANPSSMLAALRLAAGHVRR